MKTIVAFIVIFLLGASIGYYVGHSQRLAEANRIVNQGMARVEEVYDAAQARSALRAIPLVESGDTTQAVEWFARPIAIYYHKFATEAGSNSERLMLRGMIEQLASTNSIVDGAIHKSPASLTP